MEKTALKARFFRDIGNSIFIFTFRFGRQQFRHSCSCEWRGLNGYFGKTCLPADIEKSTEFVYTITIEVRDRKQENMLKDFDLEQLVEPLLSWFSANARSLPWREEPTPYRVWVSEIMLQQTRVEAVKPYFERFMRRLPDVQALAECPEDELLKLWEGLGYYNRVRNMQKAAIQIMENYGGVIPSDYDELLTLKGIGNYTAGAISSIAYGKVAPAVDGNVFRILTRVSGDDTDITKPAFRKIVEQEVCKIIPAGADSTPPAKQSCTAPQPPSDDRTCTATQPSSANRPGRFNQALMELGATVCLPNGMPLCEQCPWNEMCVARREGRIAELPVKSKAKPRRIEKRTVFIIRDGEKIAIRKRPENGLLAGLYELPNFLGEFSQDEALEKVKEMSLSPIRIEKLGEAKHIFSHIEWQMTGYMIRVEELEGQKENLLFVEAEDSQKKYAIPSAFAAYAKYMNIKLGNERF